VILIPIVALFVGVVLGILVREPVRGELGLYLAVACLAGLDTVCGGIRSQLESKFQSDVFVTGFVANMVIAFFLAWLGDQIGVNLFLVCALIFGTRIFNNLSLIRRIGLTRWNDARARKREQEAQRQAQQATQQPNIS
jgi:small basic protein